LAFLYVKIFLVPPEIQIKVVCGRGLLIQENSAKVLARPFLTPISGETKNIFTGI